MLVKYKHDKRAEQQKFSPKKVYSFYVTKI